MERVKIAIIGGGAVGLSIARACLQRGHQSVMVLEALELCGSMTSSRSSEVIHAGLYYPKGSLKTHFCIEGRQKLVQFLTSHQIDFELCGKFVVAQTEQIPSLQALYQNAQNNGLYRLELWNKSQVKQKEPEVICEQAIFSPYSGIFDSHQTLQALETEISNSSYADIVTQCQVLSGKQICINGREEKLLQTSHGEILCDIVINAAGLYAPQVAASLAFTPRETIPKPYYSKGNYYQLHGISKANRPFKHLIYPMPQNGGLGVHSTLDLSGAIRFGPDTEWIVSKCKHNPHDIYEHSLDALPELDYQVNDVNRAVFYEEIAKYWPAIRQYDLQADYAGIRPKLCGPANTSTKASSSDTKGYQMKAALDFMIHAQKDHGVEGLIHLYGIESPGWTSSLALADYVADLI